MIRSPKRPGSSGDRERRRWPYVAGQGVMLLAAIGMFLGTALPWALVLGEALWGSSQALTWTISAGFATLAASIVPGRTLALASAAFGGGIATYIAIWQTARILDRCPLSLDCLPGPGLGFLLAGGLAALYQAGRPLLGRLTRG
jgi:hypothetical protein